MLKLFSFKEVSAAITAYYMGVFFV